MRDSNVGLWLIAVLAAVAVGLMLRLALALIWPTDTVQSVAETGALLIGLLIGWRWIRDHNHFHVTFAQYAAAVTLICLIIAVVRIQVF